jgi:hypothetical protein
MKRKSPHRSAFFNLHEIDERGSLRSPQSTWLLKNTVSWIAEWLDIPKEAFRFKMPDGPVANQSHTRQSLRAALK